MTNKWDQKVPKTTKKLRRKCKSPKKRTPKNQNKLRAHKKYSTDDDKSKNWLAILTIVYFEEIDIN